MPSVSGALSARTKKQLLQLGSNPRLDLERGLRLPRNLHLQHLRPLTFHISFVGRISRLVTPRRDDVHMRHMDSEQPNSSDHQPLHLDSPPFHLGQHFLLVHLSLHLWFTPSKHLQDQLPTPQGDGFDAFVLDDHVRNSCRFAAPILHLRCCSEAVLAHGRSGDTGNEALQKRCDRSVHVGGRAEEFGANHGHWVLGTGGGEDEVLEGASASEKGVHAWPILKGEQPRFVIHSPTYFTFFYSLASSIVYA